MGKQSDRIDRELKLINAVHGIPRLWQKSDEQYKNQTSKGPIWTKLAKSCGYADVKAASLAWKNLRGNYVDKLNKKKASTGSGLDDVQMDANDHNIIRAPDNDDDDEALCGKQVTTFLRRLPLMKRRPAIIEMQQLMFRFEYDAQLVYEGSPHKQLKPQTQQQFSAHEQVGTSASFANSAADAWGMGEAVDDGNSMEALTGDPMLSSTASNFN